MRSKRPYILAVILGLTLGALTGCASKLRPGLDAAAGWSDGPKMHVGVGEYDFEVPNPLLTGKSNAPDPAIVSGIAKLEATTKVLEQKLQDQSLSQADRANLTTSRNAAETALAQAKDAKAQADKARADAASKEAPLSIPTQGGILGIVLALGGFALKSFQRRAALTAAEKAEAAAKAAIDAYDEAAFTTTDLAKIAAAKTEAQKAVSA